VRIALAMGAEVAGTRLALLQGLAQSIQVASTQLMLWLFGGVPGHQIIRRLNWLPMLRSGTFFTLLAATAD
jgi:hypothetical protein